MAKWRRSWITSLRGECINAADWKDRFKENSDRMRTGSLADVAAVLKSLLILGQAKSLSFREKKMLERARYLAGQRNRHLAQLRREPDRRGAHQGADEVQSALPGN